MEGNKRRKVSSFFLSSLLKLTPQNNRCISYSKKESGSSDSFIHFCTEGKRKVRVSDVRTSITIVHIRIFHKIKTTNIVRFIFLFRIAKA